MASIEKPITLKYLGTGVLFPVNTVANAAYVKEADDKEGSICQRKCHLVLTLQCYVTYVVKLLTCTIKNTRTAPLDGPKRSSVL